MKQRPNAVSVTHACTVVVAKTLVQVSTVLVLMITLALDANTNTTLAKLVPVRTVPLALTTEPVSPVSVHMDTRVKLVKRTLSTAKKIRVLLRPLAST